MNAGKVNDYGSLSRRLGLCAVVVIILSGVMGGLILRGTWKAASQAEQNAGVIQELYQLLNAANLIAAERAPSNILLGMAGEDQSEARNSLTRARQLTDAALQQAAPLIPEAQFTFLLHRLEESRKEVDLTARDTRPDQKRLQNTINSMFSVSDTLHEIVLKKAAKWFQEDTSLSAPVLRAISVTELRDTAGRMGSWLIAPVQTRSPLSEYNLEGLQRADERVNMLWGFLTPAETSSVSNNNRNSLRTEAREHFFREGRPLIQQLVSEGLSGGKYSYSTIGLTQRYITSLSILEKWQYKYLMKLLAEYNLRAKKESDLFKVVIFSLILITGLISGCAFIIQFRVLRPLLAARRMIVGMAEELDISLQAPPRVRELDQLFHSIEVLKVRLEERKELTRRLESLAETDELTGLYNRRAFDQTGKSWFSLHHPDVNLFLIIIDLDYFKMINDRYGHPVGDKALIHTANVIRSHIREEDMAARIGGEEFALVLRGNKIGDALALAGRIRTSLHNINFDAPDGERIDITASFGIAMRKERSSWMQMIADADAALYEAKRRGRDCIHVFMSEQSQ